MMKINFFVSSFLPVVITVFVILIFLSNYSIAQTNQWTECVSLNGTSCEIICEERGLKSYNHCLDSRGTGLACMEGWSKGGCEDGSVPSTNALYSCPPAPARYNSTTIWKCCCSDKDEPVCFDSDGGKNYTIQGYVDDGSQQVYDGCNGTVLMEWYCENGSFQSELLECPQLWASVPEMEGECMFGRCYAHATTCKETDSGQDYYAKGCGSGIMEDGKYHENVCDHCIKDGVEVSECNGTGCGIVESWCELRHNQLKKNVYNECAQGCKDGACVKPTERLCIDSDGGKDYYVSGDLYLGGKIRSDVCQGEKTLVEYYCQEPKGPLSVKNDITDGFYTPEQGEQIYVMAKQEDTPLWDDGLWDGESETFMSNEYFTLRPSLHADYSEPFGRDYSGTSNYVYIIFYRNSNALGTWPERTFNLTVDGKVITVYLPEITYTYPEHEEGSNLLSFYVAEDGSTYYAKRDHQPTTNYGQTNLSGTTYGYDPVEKLRFWYHFKMSMDMSPSEAFSPEHLARLSDDNIGEEIFECPYMCENGACVNETSSETTCSDETPYGQCSPDRPKYCDNGNLVDKCSQCGCPSGYECKDDGSCEFIEVNETDEWEEIKSGAEVSMSINKTEMGVTEIKISVKGPANNVSVTIMKLENKPADIQKEVHGKVYQYFEIKKSNFEDTNINKSLIKFKVERAWISENSINKSRIFLNRYTTDWEKLPTMMITEDDKYVYYEAETHGFSLFAVTGEEMVCVPGSKRCAGKELQKCNSDGLWKTVESCKYTCMDNKCIQTSGTIEKKGGKIFDMQDVEKSLYMVYLGIVIIIILIILNFAFRRVEKRSKLPKIKNE